MKIRTSILVGLFVVSLGSISPLTAANAEVGVYLRIPPPPIRVEVAPAPRRGYLWAPGYWNPRRDSHEWRRGHWERERRGYHYAQPNWTQRDDRWQFERGHWNNGDRDGDGVPNNRDRAPDNPHRH